MFKRKGTSKAAIAGQEAIHIEAGMKGKISFSEAVNLCINGRFEGELDTKGMLAIGEKAEVNAKIKGEIILVAGEINGDIEAQKQLELMPTSRVIGNVKTPVLNIRAGAILKGNCDMPIEKEKSSKK